MGEASNLVSRTMKTTQEVQESINKYPHFLFPEETSFSKTFVFFFVFFLWEVTVTGPKK